MKVLFANVPFIKHVNGKIHTGPNAGSRWPWTLPGPTFHDYAPYPFWLGWATTYLKEHGIDTYFYDGVAMRHSNYDQTRTFIYELKPDIVFFEVATPTFPMVDDIAKWTKHTLNSRIVYCGPHMKVYAKECIKQYHVNHCIIGEYEKPALDICQKEKEADEIYTYDHLTDINMVNGKNFVPHRPYEYLGNYYEPTMHTPRIQLTVNTSRGCPFKCTYCQWPNVMNAGKYRHRSAEMVIDEIKQVIKESGNIRSILFDDDTWNLGASRITKMCKGLKDIGMPWSFMGRIDTSSKGLYKMMVDSGCVGMRFGVETFNQQLSDNVKKNMDTKKAFENLDYLVKNFSNMEFHFTTMKNLPGEQDGSWQNDQRILKKLAAEGAKRGNKVHWQISDCIPFPGTELWDELVALGKGDELKDFTKYDGSPGNAGVLAKTVGWLGKNYKPKPSKYSGMGKPTNMPEE